MSWPRESLLLVILALSAPWACADSLTVNTTTDDDADNALCSLREAVDYFNLGRPEAGFQGCNTDTTDSYSIITLPADDAPYLIDSGPIYVRTGLTINGEGRKDSVVTTLQVTGPHRAFVLNYNPQYLKPRCAFAVPVTCASDAASLDIDSTFDTGTPGDYLTTAHTPLIRGQLPAVTEIPLPSNSYVVRIYTHPEEGDPVEVGKTKVAFSDAPIPWQVKLSRLLTDEVHRLTYTLQVVDTLSGNEVVPEGAHSDASLTLAVYSVPDRSSVKLSQMVIKGGCAIASGCAAEVNDNTAVTNDPALSNTAYDSYALSYTNGLTNTDGNGGIIFNNESLILSDVLIQDGEATLGGAVYVAADGGLKIEFSELRANRADQGAAVYAEFNVVEVQASLLVANAVNTPAGSGAVIEVAAATFPASLTSTRIINTTLSGNTGRALSLRKDAFVNASTIVLNTGGGLDFNNEDVDVANTILAGNATVNPDCENRPSTAVMLNNLVLSTGACPSTGNQTVNDAVGTEGQLMATLVGDKCASPFGLLCPLADHDGYTFVHMPRILESYDLSPLLLDASPIINKGSDRIGSSDHEACPSQDQRTKSRTLYSCDIGAVELQAVSNSSSTASGGSITYGQIYTQYLGDELADELLVPAVKCPAAVSLVLAPAPAADFPPAMLAPDPSRVVPDSYRADVPGCPWLEKAAGRGVVIFTTEGDYSYQPNSDFHGFDRFDFRVVTTLSTLNALPADRSRLVRAQVIVEPSTQVTSSKLSGALDSWGLILLAMFGLGRRRGGQA